MTNEPEIDLLLGKKNLEQWLYQENFLYTKKGHTDHHCEISKNKNGFIKFLRLKNHIYYNKITYLAKQYFNKCIPFQDKTEKIFWVITCLPGTTKGKYQRLFCFSINWMETFVVLHERKNNEKISSFINISKNIFLNNFLDFKKFNTLFPQCHCRFPKYKAAELDQITIKINNIETAVKILSDNAIVQAAKELNLRAMRKGRTPYKRFHNIFLARELLSHNRQS